MSRWTNSQRDLILASICRALDILHICDMIAVSENDGGLLVSLYNTKKKFRLCTVYEENRYTNWTSLPKRVQAVILKSEIYGGNFPSKLSDAQRRSSEKFLVPVEPFEFLRIGVKDGEDIRYYYGKTVRDSLSADIYSPYPSDYDGYDPPSPSAGELVDVLTTHLNRVYPNQNHRQRVIDAVEERNGPIASLPASKISKWIEKLVTMEPRNGGERIR